jgi:large subunit ribosomal protein LP1
MQLPSSSHASLVAQDEKISTLLKAANVEFEPFWPGLFANALAGKDVKDMVSNIGSASAAPAGAAPAGGAPAGDAAPAAAAKKEEPEEESDGEMDGFSLFD